MSFVADSREVKTVGGVENTRLEAKDTKKTRGQGQECSKPRAKDTGASVLRKKGLQKTFPGDLQKTGSSK